MGERNCESILEAGYVLGRTLGEGRFSQVLCAEHTASGAQFAAKVIDTQQHNADAFEALEALRVEVCALKAARHPNIVRLHEVVHTPAATYVLMEQLDGGELFERIITQGCFPEAKARSVLRQLLQASLSPSTLGSGTPLCIRVVVQSACLHAPFGVMPGTRSVPLSRYRPS